ncbi:MAG: efflux RND transporter periplasmic adaptor subunit [Gemmatimonadaceae bacterium]|nr:efflux RND transporter periplasmic adaptor subunit [Gemmatimonadaceae bacterium]
MTFRNWYAEHRIATWAGVIAIVAALWLVNRNRESGPPNANQSTATITGPMKMSPVTSTTSGATVVLTPLQQRQFGVTFGIVELRPISREIRTVGTVMVNESRLAKVAPKFSGYIERLFVNFSGQPVKRGQALAAVFSPELLAAQQELLVAYRLSRTISGSLVPGVPGASSDLVVAARQRLRLWDVSESQINAVLKTGRVNRTVTLFSPASGIVLDKKVVQGQAITAGEELYTIADLSDVWIDAQLREADAGIVAPGTAATLEFTSFPGRPFSGRVTYIYPVLGEATRTVRARITVQNTGRLLKPGMYATVRFNTATQSALSVPRSAVIQTGLRSIVFVDMGAGKLMPHVVTTGRTGTEYVEILTGLTRGQRVVTSAQFLIDSESNLGDVMKGMAGMGGSEMDSKGADMKNMPGMSSAPKR